MQHFNIEEILKIAIKIERNGRAFYLKAAELCPAHKIWLTRLADEEIAHENIFEMFFRSLVKKDEFEQPYEDAEDLAMTYLHAIADSIIFNLAKDPETAFSANPNIDEIIEDALRREHEAILFYTGLKNALKDAETQKQVDLIIREEMGHVAWLKEKQIEIHEESTIKDPEKTYEVVIIGGGPGGVSMGAELAERGLDPSEMLILESAPKTSWMIRKLYHDEKMVTANYKGNPSECHGVMRMRDMTKQNTLQMLADTVSDYGLNVVYEKLVHRIEKVKNLFHIHIEDHVIKARYCVLSIGVFGKPNRPDYKIPASLNAKTHFDVTSTAVEGSDVLVVGGGDSGAEYAHILMEKGNKVTLSSRESDLSYMNDENRRRTETLGLAGDITLLAGSDVEAVAEEEGKIRVLFKGEEVSSILVDHIVYALGGTTPANFLSTCGIKLEDGQPVLADDHETNVHGLYLSGDLAARSKFGAISTAFNASFDVANSLAPKLNLKLKV